MKLTKQQIQFIDNRLKLSGVKYWDIRIEMLDHIVTDVENNLENEIEFEKMVQSSFVKLGWKGSFEMIIEIKYIEIRKSYNKLLRNEFRAIFKSFKTILVFGLFILFCSIFSDNLRMIKLIMLSSIACFSVLLIFSLINYKKVFKSLHLFCSFALIGSSITILNALLYVPKFFNVDTSPSNYLAVIMAIILPLMVVGYKIFYKKHVEYNSVYQKLIRL